MTSPSLVDSCKKKTRMELNNNNSVACTDSADAQAGAMRAAEIDLYNELTSFAELSTEEQQELLDRAERLSAATSTSESEIHEDAVSEPAPSPGAIEPVVASNPPAEIEMPPVEVTQAHTSPEQFSQHLLNEPVESVTAAAETEAPAGSRAETGPDSGFLQQYLEPDTATDEPTGESRPTGPLSGFNLTPEFIFTGALTRGICLACGCESGAEDLFCLACGVFIDEDASSFSSNPTCAECNQGIEAGEIFCPWCGSPLAG
jgi:hypothetical protein